MGEKSHEQLSKTRPVFAAIESPRVIAGQRDGEKPRCFSGGPIIILSGQPILNILAILPSLPALTVPLSPRVASAVITQMADAWQILILGAGQTGVQLAAQCAAFGQLVRLYDTDGTKLARAESEVKKTLARMHADRAITSTQCESATSCLSVFDSLQRAADGANLVIECVPEDRTIKRQVFQQCRAVCDEAAIFATNTSYLLPSSLAASTGRPDRFAAFHFHVPIWQANLVDIMPHRLTSEETVDRLCQFAQAIGQVPIRSRKESPGYAFNAMLFPWLMEAIQLAAGGVLDPAEVDRVWMGITKMSIGPFGVLDNIGIDVAHKIASMWAELLQDKRMHRAAEFLAPWMETGKLGIKTDRGFYDYPRPAFGERTFLSDRVWAKEHIFALGQSPNEPRPPEMSRFILKPIPEPLPADFAIVGSLPGAVMLFGRGELAATLHSALAAQGATAFLCSGMAACAEDEAERVFEVLAANSGKSRGPVHLILVDEAGGEPGDDDATAETEQVRLTRLLTMLRLVARWQREFGAGGERDRSLLVAAVRLGGDFAGVTPGASVDDGALAGFVKGVFMDAAATQSLGPRFCVVDVGDLDANSAASAVLREMNIADRQAVTGSHSELIYRSSNLEVGYLREVRQRIRLERTPVARLETPRIEPGPWLITGGLRGITARVAQGLARCGATSLHLLGRTPLDERKYPAETAAELEQLRHGVMRDAFRQGIKPNEAWQRVERQMEMQANLRSFAANGIDATYHVCDVCDEAALATTTAQIRTTHGPIVGVLHGAGVETTGALSKKTPGVLFATLGPKFLGTLALIRAVRNDPLRYFIAFGSLSGRFGGVGQADYSGANEVLAKIVNRFRHDRPDCRSFTVHWPGWRDVGMAARRDSAARLLQTGHHFVSPEEGVAWVLHEIATGAQDGEVAIVHRDEVPDLWQTTRKARQ
jgi:3-hydroxybutyryl-CoA dehydrogenase